MKSGRNWGRLGMKYEWKECTIADLGEVVGGATPSTKKPENYENGDISWITPKDLSTFNGRFITRGERNITEIGLNSCSTRLLPLNSVLFSSRAPIGYVAIAAKEMCTNQGFKSVIPNSDTDYMFLYYLLKFNKGNIENMGSGTTFKEVSGNTMKSIKVYIPVDIEEQRKIASILSALDDKIELNNRINENLESQAQAFFTDLFITNAKPEWKTGTVSDLGDVVGGGTPSKKVEEYYTNDGIAWITPKDLSNDKSKFITHGETDITDLGLAKSSATLMPRGSVLFSSRAPIGYIAIADGQVSTNQGFKSIVPFDNVGTAYVYYFLKENLSAIENVASGSTFKEVSGGTMKNFPAIIPDADTLAKFKQFCSPLLEQQRALEYENRYLASLRDALLPKLMNGEIDVSEVKI